MVEIVAENGYDAVTVRELARLAGVSTRTFYQLYSGKEECFLQTHDLLVRRMLRRLASSQADVRDWRTRMRVALHALLRELTDDPQAARLLLVDAYSAGPAAQEQAQRVNRALGSSLGKSLTDTPDEIAIPPFVVEGIVAGVASVARNRLLTGQLQKLNAVSDRLLDWALSYCSEIATMLTEIDQISITRRSEARLRPVPSSNAQREEEDARSPAGDLALLLSAVVRLSSHKRHRNLTLRQILATAGVSRRSFYAYFKGADDCLGAALELQTNEALTRARQSSASSATWAGGIYQAIATFCIEIARSPALADTYNGCAVIEDTRVVQRHERLALAIAQLLADGAPAAAHADQLTLEASAGAIVGSLQPQKAPRGSERRSPYAVGTLTYLALAPMIGADRAIETIRQEQAAVLRGG